MVIFDSQTKIMIIFLSIMKIEAHLARFVQSATLCIVRNALCQTQKWLNFNQISSCSLYQLCSIAYITPMQNLELIEKILDPPLKDFLMGVIEADTSLYEKFKIELETCEQAQIVGIDAVIKLYKRTYPLKLQLHTTKCNKLS